MQSVITGLRAVAKLVAKVIKALPLVAAIAGVVSTFIITVIGLLDTASSEESAEPA